MDKLKITFSGISDYLVNRISINAVKKRDVDSKFDYNTDNNYEGTIEHLLLKKSTNTIIISVTGYGTKCKCDILNISSNKTYSSETKLESGGANFTFYI